MFTLNPRAKEFIPFQINPVHAQLLAQRSLERDLQAKIKKISKITQYNHLEQVAQLVYHTQTGQDVYEVLRDDNHIFLDFPRGSWQLPDMTLRQIIQFLFDDDFILNDSQLDLLASTLSSTIVHLDPIDHGENTSHSWKQIP